MKITLKKSLIGVHKDMIATANSLGLRKIGDSTQQKDSAALRGKINKISHLIEVVD